MGSPHSDTGATSIAIMAKKSKKKNPPKQAEITSTPASPKLTPAPPVEDPVSEPAQAEQLTTETPATEPAADVQPASAKEVIDAKTDDAIEVPPPGPATQETAALDSSSPPDVQNLAEPIAPKDEANAEPVAEPTTEVDAPATQETVNGSVVENVPEGTATEISDEAVEKAQEPASEVIGEGTTSVIPEVHPELSPEDKTEAVSAPAQEPPAEEPSAPTLEAPVETQHNSAVEHSDVAAPETADDDGATGHIEPALEPQPDTEDPLERSQSKAVLIEEAPHETAPQAPTEIAVVEPEEATAEDEWAPIPKKGKKGKKDKKKKQAVASDSINGVVEAPLVITPSEAQPLVEQPAQEQKGRLDTLCRALSSSTK